MTEKVKLEPQPEWIAGTAAPDRISTEIGFFDGKRVAHEVPPQFRRPGATATPDAEGVWYWYRGTEWKSYAGR